MLITSQIAATKIQLILPKLTKNTQHKTASLTGTVKRSTRPKDMIVIVNAQDQRRPDNSAEYNKIRRTFIFLTLIDIDAKLFCDDTQWL